MSAAPEYKIIKDLSYTKIQSDYGEAERAITMRLATSRDDLKVQYGTLRLDMVGALHLVGEGGLVDLLSDAGHKLEPMWKRDA